MNADLVRRANALMNQPGEVSDETLAELFTPDVVFDMSARVFNPHVYVGYDGLRQFREDAHEVWESVSVSEIEIVEEGDRVLVLNRVESHGRGSGVPMIAQSASIWTVRDGRLAHHRLLSGDRADRDEALAALRGRSNPRTA